MLLMNLCKQMMFSIVLFNMMTNTVSIVIFGMAIGNLVKANNVNWQRNGNRN
jgi:hypothetical protein